NDAMKMFEDVHRRFPDWNTVMVTYHISSCRLRIQQLEKTILPDLGRLSAEELRTRLKEEINHNAALSMELHEIRQDSRYTISDTRLHDREALISALRQQITELEVKLKLEQTKLSRMKTDDDFTKLHNELAELAMVKQKDDEKINALTHDLEDANKKIDTLEKQLAEVDKWTEAAHSTDAVKDENEQLKQIIADQNRKLAFFQENVAVFLQNKKEIDQLERMAFDLENKSDISSAARYWHTISNKYPDAQEPALRGAYWYWAIDDHDNANMLLDRYFTTTGRNADAMVLIGRICLDENNWQRALALTSWATVAAPDNVNAQFSLGAVFLSAAQTSLAKACFRKAIALEPNHGESLMALAIIYATVEPRNLKEAKEFYDKAVAAGQPRDEAFEAVVK
ncbi:MAG: hypothetical protein IKR62_08160, partial [Victivallales bacterium]|nr:hypothetical protein [Victivallales bacterium]